jgi:hypothetical protein
MPLQLSLIKPDSPQADPKPRQNSPGDSESLLRDAPLSPTLTQDEPTAVRAPAVHGDLHATARTRPPKKLQHGPLTCRTIQYDTGGEDSCRSCQHWGNVKSPVVLGVSPSAHLATSKSSQNGSTSAASTGQTAQRRNGQDPTASPAPQASETPHHPKGVTTPFSDVYNAETFTAEHGANLREARSPQGS